jgi:hypothetical protein
VGGWRWTTYLLGRQLNCRPNVFVGGGQLKTGVLRAFLAKTWNSGCFGWYSKYKRGVCKIYGYFTAHEEMNRKHIYINKKV